MELEWMGTVDSISSGKELNLLSLWLDDWCIHMEGIRKVYKTTLIKRLVDI